MPNPKRYPFALQRHRHWSAVLLFLAMSLCATFSAGAAEKPRPAPAFVGKTADGKEIKLSDYKGKVVLLDFWASWCGPCRQEMPFLVDFYHFHSKKDFQIISVNIDDKIENMNHFLDDLYERPGFPVIVDQAKIIPPLYKLETMPTTFFIDKKGMIRYQHNGFKPSYEDEIQKELAELQNEK